MRWIPFLILAYVVVLAQTTLGRVLVFTTQAVGSIGPDLMALVAVFVAFYVRGWADAMLAGWVLGMTLDLSTAGGAGSVTALGPMSIAYALAAGLIYRIREAFFRERALTQTLLAWLFCLVTHGLWVTFQSLLALKEMTWGAYGRIVLQALALASYTALLMPMAHFGLARCQRWFLAAPVGPGRRMRR